MKEFKCIWNKIKPFKDTGRILAHPLWKLARHPEAWLHIWDHLSSVMRSHRTQQIDKDLSYPIHIHQYLIVPVHLTQTLKVDKESQNSAMSVVDAQWRWSMQSTNGCPYCSSWCFSFVTESSWVRLPPADEVHMFGFANLSIHQHWLTLYSHPLAGSIFKKTGNPPRWQLIPRTPQHPTALPAPSAKHGLL